jgi:hypothetical protein
MDFNTIEHNLCATNAAIYDLLVENIDSIDGTYFRNMEYYRS